MMNCKLFLQIPCFWCMKHGQQNYVSGQHIDPTSICRTICETGFPNKRYVFIDLCPEVIAIF